MGSTSIAFTSGAGLRTSSTVVHDPDPTLNEKRAIVAPWASDAWAIEASPALRCPRGKRPVPFDVIDANKCIAICRTVSPCPSARPASQQAICIIG
jgi:hypothetical protein